MGGVAADPARQSWTLSGTVLAAQAVREGAVESANEFAMLFVQLLAARRCYCHLLKVS